jgi:hypothetical protein
MENGDAMDPHDDFDGEDSDDGEDCFERDEDEDDLSEFADPGGRSALRAASETNPRNLPCPTCGEPDTLTPKDVALGYQCDACADRAEGMGP